MAVAPRGSIRSRIEVTTLAAADDLDGAAVTLDVSGSDRVIYEQIANGTAGTAGIDIIEVSNDGGVTWRVDETLLAVADDDLTGTVVSGAALNAAGVEPTGAATFKGGPYPGKTLVRCGRGGSGEAGTAWVTGAPQVRAIVVGA